MIDEEIPLFDLRPWVKLSEVQFMEDLRQIMAAGQFIGGAPLVELQDAIRKLTGATTTLPLASGTDALTIGLKALREANHWARPVAVIPDFTFQATANAALMAGYELVLTDIQPYDYCMGWQDAVFAIACRLREVGRGSPDGFVVVPVHLYGNVCDVPQIYSKVSELLRGHGLEDKLYVMEDAAQGLGGVHYSGAPVGSMGDLAALSFFPTKPFGGYGDGGMLLATPRVGPAMDIAITISRQGLNFTKSFATMAGTNSRLDAIQALAVLQKVRQAREIILDRTNLLSYYRKHLHQLEIKVITQEVSENKYRLHSSCPSVLTVEQLNPEFTAECLMVAGIKTGCYYSRPLHLQPAYRDFIACKFYTTHIDPITYVPTPISKWAADHCLSLPFFWGMRTEQVDHVIRALSEAMEAMEKHGTIRTDRGRGENGIRNPDDPPTGPA